MKIDEYLELIKKDNDVCFDIDNHITGSEMRKYADVDSLLEDAEDVICKYRGLMYKIFNKIDIENALWK